jgi:hypothetical protein
MKDRSMARVEANCACVYDREKTISYSASAALGKLMIISR